MCAFVPAPFKEWTARKLFKLGEDQMSHYYYAFFFLYNDRKNYHLFVLFFGLKNKKPDKLIHVGLLPNLANGKVRLTSMVAIGDYI